jgi:transposase-like protein
MKSSFECNGQQQYLWRAVDQDSDVTDILVQPHRDQRAAERFFRRLLRGQGKEPLRIITDKQAQRSSPSTGRPESLTGRALLAEIRQSPTLAITILRWFGRE